MKKISYYIIILIIAGLSIISFWAYQKYFKQEKENVLTFKVERGNIQEIIKTRGEAIALKDFDLKFPFSGIVENIFVKEGQSVNQGAPLIKLETIDFELEEGKLRANLIQAKANLNKLIAGATKEDIAVYENKVSSAKSLFEDTKKNIVDKLQDAYTKSDDAVRNKADQIFNNPRTANPQLSFTINNSQLDNEIRQERLLSEDILNSWKLSLDQLIANSDLSSYINTAKKNFDQISLFLYKAALAVNSITSTSISQTTINGWKTDIASARTNVNTAISNLTAAEKELETAKSSLSVTESELTAKTAAARSEDIEIANAQIKEIESQIAIIKEKIKKSTLYSPIAAKITKIFLEKGELFSVGETAISLSASGYKIKSDISELDIGKIKESNGNDVAIKLDAFPSQEFKGKIISVEPQEIIKEGDKYYRTNIYFENPPENIRSGMNADIIIYSSFKENVLKIPELAVYKKGNEKFVKLIENEKSGEQKEIKIETGISDGEFIEIASGLEEGQIIAVSAE